MSEPYANVVCAQCECCYKCALGCPCVTVGNIHVIKCEKKDCKNAAYTCTVPDGICDDCAEEEHKCYMCDTLIDSTIYGMW